MLCARTRGDHHDRNAAGRRALAELDHEFVAGHARHFEGGDDQMAAVLSDQLGGLQAVGGELYAGPGLFPPSSEEFAHGDGVVGDDDNALVFHAVDGVGGNGAASDGLGTWSEDPRRTGVCLQGPTLGRFGGDHAIEINQQNQTAVGRDGGAREKLYATEIFAEIFDDDFVLAENIFDDEPNLAATGVGHDHTEVAVNGFERRKAEIAVEANDFGDDVAHLGDELAADVFDLVGTDATNFFDDAQRKRVAGAAAANEQSGRDDER